VLNLSEVTELYLGTSVIVGTRFDSVDCCALTAVLKVEEVEALG